MCSADTPAHFKEPYKMQVETLGTWLRSLMGTTRARCAPTPVQGSADTGGRAFTVASLHCGPYKGSLGAEGLNCRGWGRGSGADPRTSHAKAQTTGKGSPETVSKVAKQKGEAKDDGHKSQGGHHKFKACVGGLQRAHDYPGQLGKTLAQYQTTC